jgi:hypothetical protein
MFLYFYYNGDILIKGNPGTFLSLDGGGSISLGLYFHCLGQSVV